MFSRSNKPTKTPPRDRRTAPSIIASDCALLGDVTSEGEVQIDGAVKGDVRCKVLVVGHGGTVTGQIAADEVRVLGTVVGDIRAHAVHLAPTASVRGAIVHDSLTIEAGAVVEGLCQHVEASKAPPPAVAEEKAEANELPVAPKVLLLGS
jgi:cytoskeletal protein CcmA (bactofilin family)